MLIQKHWVFSLGGCPRIAIVARVSQIFGSFEGRGMDVEEWCCQFVENQGTSNQKRGVAMKAIEFETDEKGNIIEIPEKYSHLYSMHLKIIALVAEQDPESFHVTEGKKT